ncbi:hypothetical protein KAR91_62000 [Candidatus Pacearchaeota archaeon]|nr:hypothetical protein [Candidatus Pacearchaeota archaeon]
MEMIPHSIFWGWAWYFNNMYGIADRIRFEYSEEARAMRVILGPRNDGVIELTGEQIVRLLERAAEQRKQDAYELSRELGKWRGQLEG